MNVHARKAMTDDREKLVNLWRRFVTEEGDAVEDMVNVDEEAKKWAWRLDKQIEEGVAFVVLRDEEIIGFTCYIGYRETGKEEKTDEISKGVRKLPLAPGVAFISDIYIEPSARESPTAKLLFGAIVHDIQARGYNTIWTNTSVRNRRTQILLERVGFKETEAFTHPGMKNQVYYEWKIR